LLAQLTGTATPPPEVPEAASEVVVRGTGTDAKCDIDPAVRAKVRKLVSTGIGRGYRNFPIDRKALEASIADEMLSDDNICHAIRTGTGATEATHEALREEYMGEEVEPKDAFKKGAISRRLELKAVCPDAFDWKGSPNYCGVSKCSDVTGKFTNGLPVAMYGVFMPAASAHAFIDSRRGGALYSKYDNDGPEECISPHASPRDEVAYHALALGSGYVLDFIMRSMRGDGWSAWEMLKSCTRDDGSENEQDDLKFDFGFRVFVPLDVEVAGERRQFTLIVESVAAASNNFFAPLVTNENKAYRRYLGGVLAKKVLFEAWAKGWVK
jgi:hypothetical protein